jgi:hypothetical protein
VQFSGARQQNNRKLHLRRGGALYFAADHRVRHQVRQWFGIANHHDRGFFVRRQLAISSELFMFRSTHLYRKRAIGFLRAAAALLMLAVPAAAQLGLGLTPMRVELRMKPGGAYTGALRMINEGAEVRVRTSLLDFRVDSEQTPQFEENLPGEAAYSCRRWLTVNPMETELRDKTDMPVRYTIRVPADAQPRSYYCAVGITSLPPAPGAQGFGLQAAVRVVAAFYVIVGNPAVEGRLSDIAIEQAPGSKDLRAVVVLENSGHMYFRAIGSLTVFGTGGQILETYEVTPLPILPERKQRLLFPLKIAEGQPCTVQVRVDLGTGEVQEGRVTVQGDRARN